MNAPTPADSPAPTAAGTLVEFEVSQVLPLPAGEAWRRLTDWPGHGEWIPLTRIDVSPDDPDRFVAWSGFGPLALEDRMVVAEQRRDGEGGYCRVHKLGPVLVGEAEFRVLAGFTADTSVVQWREAVTVRRLPRPLAPLVARLSGRFFARSLRRMARRR